MAEKTNKSSKGRKPTIDENIKKVEKTPKFESAKSTSEVKTTVKKEIPESTESSGLSLTGAALLVCILIIVILGYAVFKLSDANKKLNEQVQQQNTQLETLNSQMNIVRQFKENLDSFMGQNLELPTGTDSSASEVEENTVENTLPEE